MAIVKDMPYELTHRHRYWFIDIRYLVRIGPLQGLDQGPGEREDEAGEDQDTSAEHAEHWVYSLCIIEGYSRKILAGMASPYQDVVAVLQLLSAALSAYGRPEGIVSDNGSVFTSDAYEGLLTTLGIEVCHIEKGKPWQNLIEAQFKVERRLADAQIERAATLAEIQERHAAFVETFNTTPHWAHRERADGLRTPEETLGWVHGRELEPDALPQALRTLQVARTVNRAGYVSVQRFYLYAERGLARKRVSVWLYDGRLHLAHQQALLAQYTYHAERARQATPGDACSGPPSAALPHRPTPRRSSSCGSLTTRSGAKWSSAHPTSDAVRNRRRHPSSNWRCPWSDWLSHSFSPSSASRREWTADEQWTADGQWRQAPLGCRRAAQPADPRELRVHRVIQPLIRRPKITAKPLCHREILRIVRGWAVELGRQCQAASQQGVINHRLNRLRQE